MSVKGIRFNGETIEIPTEYLQSVSIDGNTITFTKSDGTALSYTSSSTPEMPTNLVTTDTDQTITGTKRFETVRFTNDDSAIVIGTDAGKGKNDVVSIGAGYLDGNYNVAIGGSVRASTSSNVFIGAGGNIYGGGKSVCIASGSSATVGEGSVSVGYKANATAKNSIQLGSGNNAEESTFQVFGHQLLNAEGKIPNDRLNISTDGLASEDYVNTQISNLIDSAPDTLNTLNELAVAIQENDTLVDTLNSAIGQKVNSADLATVATSGSYNDLKDNPTIGSSYNSGNQGFSIVNSDGIEKGIYFKSDDFKASASGPIPNDYRTISLKDVVRTTDVAQDIAGTKNFTGSLQKNGVEVATTNDIPVVPSYVQSITETDIVNWNNKSEFSGSYNDLTDKPTTFSGDYNDLTNKPTIPTKTSQLTNDMNYIESGGLDFTYISKLDVYNELTSPSITATGYLYFENESDDYYEAISNPHWWINMNSDRFGIHAYNSDIDSACLSIDHTTGDATFYNKVNAYVFNASSDRRLKENIKDYKCKKSILDLPIKEFDYKKTGTHSIGCIAQDLQEICPEIVNTDKDGYLSIQENKLVYLLLQEVKQLKAEIDKLKGV